MPIVRVYPGGFWQVEAGLSRVTPFGFVDNGPTAGPTLRGLVLKNGRIQQCPYGEEGTHPPLTINNGRLQAGATGTRLVLDQGRIRQAYAAETVVV